MFAKAAGEKGKPYAGTALYSLAEDRRATPSDDAGLQLADESMGSGGEGPLS